MLLHRDAEDLSQKKPEEDSKEETHVVALSVCEQVLLITCKVKVTAADGSSTISRAMIDPGSSGPFVYERLQQHLRLPSNNKNETVEGVAGASTPIHKVRHGSRCLA